MLPAAIYLAAVHRVRGPQATMLGHVHAAPLVIAGIFTRGSRESHHAQQSLFWRVSARASPGSKMPRKKPPGDAFGALKNGLKLLYFRLSSAASFALSQPLRYQRFRGIPFERFRHLFRLRPEPETRPFERHATIGRTSGGQRQTRGRRRARRQGPDATSGPSPSPTR